MKLNKKDYKSFKKYMNDKNFIDKTIITLCKYGHKFLILNFDVITGKVSLYCSCCGIIKTENVNP